MNYKDKNSQIGSLLKSELKERSMSLRNFSKMTGIDPATISKIINGKRKATPDHLERFAEHLKISLSTLYAAAGYPVNQNNTDHNTLIDPLKYMLNKQLLDKELRVEDVKDELEKYKQYSQTKEGTEAILVKFEKKIKKVGSMGPFIQLLKEMYDGFSQKKGTKVELLMIGGALLYFISTIDCIPDYLFPVGYIDDALVINWVMNGISLKKML